MDNRRFLVIGDDRKTFDRAMEIAWGGCHGNYATGFAERSTTKSGEPDESKLGFEPTGKYIVVFWNKGDPNYRPKDYQSFLGGKAKLATVQEMLWGWLQEQEIEPCDIDGSVGRGFAVYNDAWGHVDGDPYAFMAFCAVPALYGK